MAQQPVRPSIDDAVASWIEPFAASKRNRRSAMPGVKDQSPDYRQKVARIAQAFEEQHPRPMRISDLFGPAPNILLMGFRDLRRNEPTMLRPTSRNAYRRVFNSFVTYLRRHGLPGNGHVAWRMERTTRPSLRTFSAGDIERMFVRLTARDTVANRCLAALISLGLDHGGRRGDALSLRLSTLDLAERRATLSIKGDKQITVPLGEIAVRALRRYLELRVDSGNHDLVFLNAAGTRPVSGDAVGKAFRRLLLALDIARPASARHGDDLDVEPDRLSFQTLRRTFVKHYLRAGRSERELIAIVGWDPEYGHQVFEHYSEVGIDELAAVHEDSSPLSRILGSAA